jgi:hypothetical protein
MKAGNSLENFYRGLTTLGNRFGYVGHVAGQESALNSETQFASVQ